MTAPSIVAALSALTLCLALPCSEAAADALGSLPADSVVAVSVPDAGSDEGISWLLRAWTDSSRESAFRAFVQANPLAGLAVAVLPSEGEGDLAVLAILELESPIDANDASLRSVIAADGAEIRESNVGGLRVFAAEQAAEGGEFTAYAARGTTVFVATHAEILSRALVSPPLAGAQAYATARQLLPADRDGELYADNAGRRFAEFLHPLERKWGMSLLLSADSLEWLASSFDIVDSDTMRGSIVFQGAGAGDLADIQDDAEFLGEAFKRKFMAERIDYTGSVKTAGTTVTLTFTIRGLEPLWLRLFEQGLLSVIRPAS